MSVIIPGYCPVFDVVVLCYVEVVMKQAKTRRRKTTKMEVYRANKEQKVFAPFEQEREEFARNCEILLKRHGIIK